MSKIHSLLMAVLSVFYGCAALKPQLHDGAPRELPSEYNLYEEGTTAPDQWWTSYNSEELNTLVKTALKDNLTLGQIYARLEQARLYAIQSGASRYPVVSLSSNVSTARRHSHNDMPVNSLDAATQKLSAVNALLQGTGAGASTTNSGLQQAIAGLSDARTRLGALNTLLTAESTENITTTTESYTLGLSTSYEVDLWGRIQSTYEAAKLDMNAAREDLYSAMLSLSGAVAGQWLSLAACRQEMAVVEKQLELNKVRLELLELRYRRGLSSALDVLQQRQIIAETEALVPSLEAGCVTAIHELKLLLGRYTEDVCSIHVAQIPALPPFPQAGVPADLLARRPDVRKAGLALQAADWRVAAARADRLPSLRLTTSASYGAEAWSLLFNNWAATLAASVTGPIFEGGRRKAEVLRTRSVVDERLKQYQLAVVTAVKEVEDALVEEKKQTEYIAALERQLQSAQSSHDQALDRYRNGVNDYLPVLSSLTALQTLERMLVRARFNQSLYRQHLHLALGGSWMHDEAQLSEKNL